MTCHCSKTIDFGIFFNAFIKLSTSMRTKNSKRLLYNQLYSCIVFSPTISVKLSNAWLQDCSSWESRTSFHIDATQIIRRNSENSTFPLFARLWLLTMWTSLRGKWGKSFNQMEMGMLFRLNLDWHL